MKRSPFFTLVACLLLFVQGQVYTSTEVGKRRVATQEAEEWSSTADPDNAPDKATAESRAAAVYSEVLATALATQNVSNGSSRSSRTIETGGYGTPGPGSDETRYGWYGRGLVDYVVPRFSGAADRWKPRISIASRADVLQLRSPTGTPPPAVQTPEEWSFSQDPRWKGGPRGCPHGTLSHFHVEGSSTDRECDWPSVPMCQGGTRDQMWCPCDADGILATPGQCDASLNAAHCPGGGTCTPVQFNRDWVATISAAQFNADIADAAYTSVTLTGTRPDTICDGYNETGANCAASSFVTMGEHLNDANKRVRRYTYNVDYGSPTANREGLIANVLSTTQVRCCLVGGSYVSPNWTPGGLVGQTVYLRASDGAASPESKTITANGVDTITVGSPWTVAAAAGQNLVILNGGQNMTQAVTVSAIETDMRTLAFQRWSAARYLHYFFDLGVPSGWPISVGETSKPGMRAAMWPGAMNPCSIGGSRQWSGVTRLAPMRLANSGCAGLFSATTHDTLYAPGEYQQARCGLLNAILDQTEPGSGAYYDDVVVHTVDAPAFLGVLGATTCTDVSAHPRYEGHRYTVLTRNVSAPVTTVVPVCGNSVTEGSEQCDDGNSINTDACISCVAAVCGDGYVRSGVEECDDSNTTNGDGCSSVCEIEVSSPIAPVLVASTLQGATCVAPCVVHTDLIGTTATGYSYPVHQLDYKIDCGDPDAGYWRTRAGGDKNAPEGVITGCVYENPGTYTITATVCEPANASCATDDATVTVANPAPTFPTTNTVCVSQSGTFSDCPDGGTGVRVTTDDFDAALLDNDKCNVDGGKRRCLLRCGETFTQGTTLTFIGGTSPGLVGCYGGAAGATHAIVTSTVPFGTIARGWTVTGLDWTNTTNQTVAPPSAIDTNAKGWSGETANGNWLAYGNKIKTTRGPSFTVENTAGNPNLIGVVGNELTVLNPGGATGGFGYSQMFFRGHRALVMGNIVDSNSAYRSEFNIRSYLYRGAIQSNDFLDAQAGERNPIQLRTYSTGADAFDSEFVSIARNFTANDISNVGSFVRVCQESGCNDDGAGGSSWTPRDALDVIIEKNHHTCTGTACSLSVGAYYLQGSRITVRNNMIDLQGAITTGNTRHKLVWREPNHTDCTADCTPAENIWAHHNTVTWSEASARGMQFCDDDASSSGDACQLNFAYHPNDAASPAETEGTWTTGGNVRVTGATNRFAAAFPPKGYSRPFDFLIPSSTGVGYARDVLERASLSPYAGTTYDALGRLRTDSSLDAGAMEYDSDVSVTRKSFEGTNAQPASGSNGFEDLLGAGATFSNTRAFTGSTSARIPVPASTVDAAVGGRWNTIALPAVQGGKVIVRAHVWWDGAWSFAASPYLKLLRVRSRTGGTEQGYNAIYINNPNGSRQDIYRLDSEDHDPAGGAVECLVGPTEDPVLNAWETYEFEITADNTAAGSGGGGRMLMRRNGKIICESTTLETLENANSELHQIEFIGYWNGTTPGTPQAAYLDDVSIVTVNP